MKEITIGLIGCAETEVDSGNTALSAGSGSLEVYATPMMIALMEKAACGCIASCLDESETSVGTSVKVSHIAPSPCGMHIRAEAEVTAVNGHEISFYVRAFDSASLIGEGEHKRYVVDIEKFSSKAVKRLG